MTQVRAGISRRLHPSARQHLQKPAGYGCAYIELAGDDSLESMQHFAGFILRHDITTRTSPERALRRERVLACREEEGSCGRVHFPKIPQQRNAVAVLQR